LTNNQIAEVLFISPKTVRKHIENIYQKLQVHNRVEAVNVAVRDKLISIGLPIVSALLRFVFN